MRLFLALASCTNRYGLPERPAPYENSTVDTADTGLPPSPSQWGSCLTVRSVLAVGGPESQWINAVVEAPDGGRYLTASSGSVLTLGAGTPNEVSFTPLGEYVGAVVRFDAEDAPVWAVSVDGDQAWLSTLAIQPDGGVVAGGACDGTTVLASGAVPTGCPILGESDGWLVRFDPDGAVGWTRWFGGPGDDAVRDLVAWPDGGFVASGALYGATTFGQGEPTETVLASPVGSGAWLARYSATGDLLWARAFGGTTSFSPEGLSVDASGDAITVVGTFEGDGVAVWGDGVTAVTVDPAGYEVFVATYGADGAFRWVETAGGTGAYAGGAARAASGGAYGVGWFRGTVTFGRDEDAETSFVTDPYSDMWLASYAPDGTLAWAAASRSEASTFGHAAAASGEDVLVSVEIHGSSVFGADAAAPWVFRPAPETGSSVLALYGSVGELLCAVEVTSAPTNEPWAGVEIHHLVERSDGGWDALGEVWGVATFGPGGPEVSAVYDDAFVATLDRSPE